MAKGEIAKGEQFLLWPQCFQLYLTIKLSFKDIFQVFVNTFSKLSAVDLFDAERSLTKAFNNNRSTVFVIVECIHEWVNDYEYLFLNICPTPLKKEHKSVRLKTPPGRVK